MVSGRYGRKKKYNNNFISPFSASLFGIANIANEDSSMSTKEEYLAKLKTQLDSWQTEVNELEAKATEATADLKVELDEQLANLRVKFADGETKFQEFADSTDEAWEELKGDAEVMFDKLIGDFKADAEHAAEGAKGIFAKIKSLFG
jgi:hypothetical protein